MRTTVLFPRLRTLNLVVAYRDPSGVTIVAAP
jgi:hypothetical protein